MSASTAFMPYCLAADAKKNALKPRKMKKCLSLHDIAQSMDHFVVSARKYRPQTFVTVVGQGHITSTLKNAISRGQLAHAYLFCGPRGVGKTTCARIFAKSINCLSPKDSEACGECESCRAFSEERSFNIHELDAASNNSVEDIRSLTEQVRIPPQIGRYSVYIIDEVHMLSAAAFNAFLKTLEEPPAHAIFILATTEKHKIIPTILSRCQIYDFNRIRVEDGVAYLKYVASQEGVTADDESLNLISQKADGGMRDALSMFDKAVSFCGNTLHFKEVAQTLNVLDYDIYFGVTQMLSSGDYPGALKAFDAVLRAGFSGQTFMAGLSNHFRDLLMCKSPQTLPVLEITGSLLERYKQQSAQCDVQFLFGAIALLSELESSLKTALNQRLHVELGLMKLSGMGEKKSDRVNASLPELKKNQHITSQPTVTPASQPVPDPAPEKETPVPAATPAPPAPPEQRPEAKPETRHAAATSSGTGISGQSIASILSSPLRPQTPAGPEESEKRENDAIDPEAGKKIAHFATRFQKSLQAERPRIASAFTGMAVDGNTIKVAAGSQELHDEIMRNRTEILDMLAAVAGVTGRIEMEVKVIENHGIKKPVKVEDRLKYLTDMNPLVAQLRKELDFELE